MSSSQPVDFCYQGNELEIFAHARNWKDYWLSRVTPFIQGQVLEVGAGVGANTLLLRPFCHDRYLCLEPDRALISQLDENIRRAGLFVECYAGTVGSLPRDSRFDTAIYVDVLEHIEDDSAELRRVARQLRPAGHIIVLSPAYQLLYSPFDRAIGHYRRYTRSSILRCTPPECSVVHLEYLDSLGGLLSLANRVLLRQDYPTLGQILFWDRRIVPLSRIADAATGFRAGKSILCVWRVSG